MNQTSDTNFPWDIQVCMGCGLEGQRNAVSWDHFWKTPGCLRDLLGFIVYTTQVLWGF